MFQSAAANDNVFKDVLHSFFMNMKVISSPFSIVVTSRTVCRHFWELF